MPVFRYKAVNPAGDVATGEIEAANESEIVDRLRDQGMLPMQVARAVAGATTTTGSGAAQARKGPGILSRLFAAKTVTGDQLLAITRELATLMRAGLPLDRALEVLIGLSESPPTTILLQQIRDEVRGGKSLSQALDMRRDVFSRFYVNIVRAGEAGGALGVVLTRLAETMERNKELRESVKSALIYPTILIGVAVTSVLVLLVWVVPQFEQTFAQAGKALPLPTLVVVYRGHRAQALVVGGHRARRVRGVVRASPASRSRRASALGRAAPSFSAWWATSSAKSRWRDSRARSQRSSATA